MPDTDLTIAQAAVLLRKSNVQAWRILKFFNMEHPDWQLLRREPGTRPYRVNPRALRLILRGDADIALESLTERVTVLETDVGSLGIRTARLEKTTRERLPRPSL